MDDRGINEMTLLLTAANVMVNIEILDVSKQLLVEAVKHNELLKQQLEENK